MWGKITDGGDVVVEELLVGKKRERCAQLGRENEFLERRDPSEFGVRRDSLVFSLNRDW